MAGPIDFVLNPTDDHAYQQTADHDLDRDRDHASNQVFQHPWIDSQTQVRLLTVKHNSDDLSQNIECELQIARVADLPQIDYVALSYYWGEARTDADIHEIVVDKQRFWVRTNLWAFFQSSQSSELRLPIYIDAICLNQLDNSERGHQVKLMSKVYNSANQTHVWLGEPHPEQDSNLRLLQSQHSGDVAQVSWQTAAIVGLSYICSRSYWRRLWIVQELLLSQVIMIHCGSYTFSWDQIAGLAKLPLSNTIFDIPEELMWWDAFRFPQPRDFSRQRAQEDRLLDGWQPALRLLHCRREWLTGTHRQSGAELVVPSSVGLPFHQAVAAFRYQQCRDRKDKIYALIGLLDSEGQAMIAPSYHYTLEEIHVQATAASLVSRWKTGEGSRDEMSLNFANRRYCDTLNMILGLSDSGIEARLSRAMEIAGSYMDSMQIWPQISGLQDRATSGNAVSSTNIGAALPNPLYATHGADQHMAESLFQQTLRNFKNELTDAEKQDFAATDLKTLKVTIAVIQNKQRATGTMQNMPRLNSFLKTVDDYGQVVDHLLQVTNVVPFIWGPMKFLLEVDLNLTGRVHAVLKADKACKITSTWSEAFDGMLKSYESLGDSLPSLAHTQALSESPDHQSEVVGVFFRSIFEFHKLALHYFKKPAWQQLFSANWKQLEARLGGFINEIRDHKGLVETQANVVELEQARQGRLENDKRLTELLEEARQTRRQNDENFAKLNEDEVIRRRTQVLSWLSPPDTMSDQDHERYFRDDNPTSGQWLLRNARFRAWYDKDILSTPLLWVTGMPGAGKSVLASLVVDESLKLSKTATVFFYCKHNDPAKNSFLAMARSVLHQLLTYDDTLLMYLFEAATKRGEITLRTVRLAKEMLSTCLKAVGKTHAIIDGIDECVETEQQHIAKFWLGYVEDSCSDPYPSRCALFSQDDASTRPLFSKLTTIHVHGKDHDTDITSYCFARAQRLQQQFELTEHETNEIASRTTLRANGMFLFARLVLANLSDQVTRLDLYAEMAPGVFPEKLNAAYARIIDRVLVRAPTPYRKNAIRLLAWVTCATRLLKWREIQAAVSIDMDRELVDFPRRQLLVDSKRLLGALVEELPNGDVNFVHSTVKPYLLSNGHVNAETEHASLTELCLNYFCLPAFSKACAVDQVQDFIKTGTYAFTEYALVSWTVHLEHALESMPESGLPVTLIEALDTFFELHWKTPRKRSKPTKRITRLTDRIVQLNTYGKVKESLSSLHCLMSTTMSDMEPVQAIDLYDVLTRVRGHMETMALQSDTYINLQQFYGPLLFKCPRLYCKWFHEGFSTLDQRISHVEKHERSHYCPTVGCLYATLGYPTAKELARHVFDAHQPGPSEEDFPAEETPTQVDIPIPDRDVADADDLQDIAREIAEELPATPLSEADPIPSSKRGRKPRFVCDLCPRTFTRGFNLRAHLRTHTDERPSVCTVCGKAFARHQDRKRHEALHNGERKFVCRGMLHNDGTWGCGRRFARADALGRHFRSEVGRVCITPLLEEERAEQLKAQLAERQQSQTIRNVVGGGQSMDSVHDQIPPSEPVLNIPPVYGTTFHSQSQSEESRGTTLPAALLQQYPALAGIDWNADNKLDSFNSGNIWSDSGAHVARVVNNSTPSQLPSAHSNDTPYPYRELWSDFPLFGSESQASRSELYGRNNNAQLSHNSSNVNMRTKDNLGSPFTSLGNRHFRDAQEALFSRSASARTTENFPALGDSDQMSHGLTAMQQRDLMHSLETGGMVDIERMISDRMSPPEINIDYAPVNSSTETDLLPPSRSTKYGVHGDVQPGLNT